MEVPLSNYCIAGDGNVRSGINVSTLQKNPLPSPPGGTSRWKQLSFKSLVNCSKFLLKCYMSLLYKHKGCVSHKKTSY